MLSDLQSRFLSKVIRKASSGALPASMTLGVDADGTAFWELGKLLRNHLSRNPADGKLRVDLSGELANPQFWLNLGGVPAPRQETRGASTLDQSIKRLLLEHPEASAIADAIRASAPIRNYLAKGGIALSTLSRLYAAVAANETPTTLSQLGSDIFNDSKALRSGSACNALTGLAAIVRDLPDGLSRRQILASCGIEENPFTSFATVFAPFAFSLDDGTEFSFPLDLFRKGLAVQLPLETAKRISRVFFPESPREITTSENAAPFASLVEQGVPCVYTEGYPNSAVRALLTRFAEAGLSVRHHGDTDLDGRLIACQVFKCIPGIMAEPPPNAPSIPLAEPAARRLSSWLAANPNHPFAERLSLTLANGWVEQESWSR